MRFLRSIAIVVALSAASANAQAQETHPFSVHDMLAMQRISQMAPSPDGKQLAFTLRTTDLEANRGRTDLWLIDANGDNLRRLTTDPAGDNTPIWSPDGSRLYFLSSRSGSSQVWSLPMGGGEAQQVTNLPLDVANLVLSPQGDKIAFSLEVFVDCAGLDCTTQKLQEKEDAETTGMIYDQLFVRHWDTWKDGRRNHVFVAKLEADGKAGLATDVMPGMDADSPSRPFGGSEEFTFTPSGDGIVFTARTDGPKEPWSTDHDLYWAPADGSRKPVCLTDDNPAWDTAPRFSPDGKTLAYTAMKVPGYEADRQRVVTREWKGQGEVGPANWLSEDWDSTAYSLSWTPDGKGLLVHTPHVGRRALFRLDAKSGEAKLLVNDGTVTSEVAVGNEIFFTRNSMMGPDEIYSIGANGKGMKQITQINEARLAQARRGEREQFQFTGANGDQVYGWIVKPVDFQAGKKYPVAFLIHGGPQGSFGDSFHYRWNPQAYAGAGYAAVMIDFHGSTGYGQAFCDAIGQNWGDWPLVDLQEGLEYALDAYPFLDGERVGALGASYGGYMINWIAGHWPDRFTCLVNHDGLFNLESMYTSTEELWFPEREFGGTPWTNPEQYRKWSPSEYVENWRTPMLVVHGLLDFRVPYSEGLSTFTALQRKGIESKLLIYPDENHWVLKPANSVQWHDEVIGWLDRFNK